MILGSENIKENIVHGVEARFNDDGTQKLIFLPVDGENSYTIEDVINVNDDSGNMLFPLVQNVDDYDFKIEGTTVDLRLDRLFKRDVYSKVFLANDFRDTGKSEEVLPVYYKYSENDDKEHKVFTLEPGVPYIGVTKEQLNMPVDLGCRFKPRVTMFSSGIFIASGFVNPNFYGKIKFGIINLNRVPNYIEQGFRVISAVFEEILGETNAYTGYHQGGNKITTDGMIAPPR